MQSTTTWAKVQTAFTGMHRWEGAPEEVEFLGLLHRHEFHVTVELAQAHDNRDLEYIMFKRALDEFLDRYGDTMRDTDTYLGNKSCEMIAKDIIEWVRDEYGNRSITVEVLEDGENGAVVEYESAELLEKR